MIVADIRDCDPEHNVLWQSKPSHEAANNLFLGLRRGGRRCRSIQRTSGLCELGRLDVYAYIYTAIPGFIPGMDSPIQRVRKFILHVSDPR